MDPATATALGSLITAACIALSGFVAVFFKGLSHSRCSKVNACCFSCDRDVMTQAEVEAEEAGG